MPFLLRLGIRVEPALLALLAFLVGVDDQSSNFEYA